MTQADRDRLVAVRKAAAKKITQKQAAAELGLSERQLRRLVQRFRGGGDGALIHGLRGRRSHRKIEEPIRQRAVEILSREVYRGFGPTLASEYLANKHGIGVSEETARKWMIEAGLWKSRRQKVKEIHVWRPRRDRFGELVQWDTSDHDWLEGRGERLSLIHMIDDATSRLLGRFVRHDSTEENLAMLEAWLRRYGRPLEFYTDKASLFQTAVKTKRDQQRVGKEAPPMPPTQIGRALRELGIGWLAAHSPQAKGRIEKSFQTAQDRLVKGLRVAGVGTMEGANEYLEREFLPGWEDRFTVVPASGDNAHRLLLSDHDLAAILCRVEERVVGHDFTFRYRGHRYQIDPAEVRPRMRQAQVRVEQRSEEEIAVRFEDRYLRVGICPPVGKVAPRLEGSRSKPRAREKSSWMKDFWQSRSPSLRQAIVIANATS